MRQCERDYWIERGECGEAIVAEWLQARDWYVLPTSFCRKPTSPGGAATKATGELLIVPDIQAHRGGLAKWVEVKTKSRDVPYRKTNEVRQGIEHKYFREYCRVAEESGMPGDLAFLVLESSHAGLSTLRVAPLDTLDRHYSPSFGSRSRFNGAPMVFWPIDIFDSFEVHQTELRPLAPRVSHPWPQRAKVGKVRKQGFFQW